MTAQNAHIMKTPTKNLRAVLFLDVDGVLNTTRLQAQGDMTNFSPVAVQAMQEILSTATFDVVISSSWRTDSLPLLHTTLVKYGLHELKNRIDDVTPSFPSEYEASRGDEIDAWLHQNGHTGRLAILDDEPANDLLRPWWVTTNMEIGLTSSLAHQVTDLLVSGPLFNPDMEI